MVSMERGSTIAPVEGSQTTGLPIGRDETQTTEQVTEAPTQQTTEQQQIESGATAEHVYETTGFQATTQSAAEHPETTQQPVGGVESSTRAELEATEKGWFVDLCS